MDDCHAQLKTWVSRRIEENMGGLYAMAKRLTRNETDAEDLVAGAVTKAWVSIHGLKDRKRFRSWIYRIQRNIFISQYRKAKVRPDEEPYEEDCIEYAGHEVASLLIEQPDEFLNWWANPEQNFLNNLLCDDIRRAIEKLPEAFRETVFMVNIEGFSYDEAAEALGVSPGTVRSRMNRGRTLLQKFLWQHAYDAGLTHEKTNTELTK